MDCFDTYCDIAFLDRFVGSAPDPNADSLSRNEEDALWDEVRTFMQQDTDLYVDAAREDLPERHIRLLTHRPGSQTELRFVPDALQHFEGQTAAGEPSSAHELVFAEKEADGFQPERHGVLCLSYEALVENGEWKRIGQIHALSVNQQPGDGERLHSWSDLERFATPLTALIVCDRYMLTGKKKAERNLYRMLLTLLPKESEVSVEITLLTAGEKRGRWIPYGNIEALHEDLRNYLERERPELLFSLCVAVPQKEDKYYHDRHVFTNYGFIMSGTTLNYFDKNDCAAVDTSLLFMPLVKSRFLTFARAQLQVVEDAMPPVECIGDTQYAVGSLENKLFSNNA